MRKHKRASFSRFILMALLEEGPLNLKELEERAFIFVYHFHGFGYSLHAAVQKKLISFLSWLGYRPREDYSEKMKKWREKHEQQINVQLECKRLIEKGLVRLNEEEKYELTENGIEEAEKKRKRNEKSINFN